jgi:uncharacterized iron-regulated membrane protein
MLMWCLSGIIMMYVRYPSLSETRRLAALEPINWHGCCVLTLEPERPAQWLSIEMLGDRPVARIAQGDGPARLIDLTDGQPIDHISADQARSVALEYGPAPSPPTLIDRDQWTVSSEFRYDRPLYRFDLGDPAGTQLYVSGTSGKAAQITTRSQRFWNWLGAIPHWLYFTQLRAHVALWSQVVIWTSVLGCFLVGTGLYLGVRQLRRASDGRWSPYRGFMPWHHLPGLFFGLFVLTWVLSGLISMNPWGFLDSVSLETNPLRAEKPSGAIMAAAVSTLARAAPADIVSIAATPFDGHLAFIATANDGTRRRLDPTGGPMSAPDIVRAAALLNGRQPELLPNGDSYYFDSRGDGTRLPVYRVIAGGVRYYLDPLSGDIVRAVDADARLYRWLHEGPHRLDFTPALRRRPFWDLIMLPLMLGVTAVCGTGVWLGLRRLGIVPRP